MYGHAHSTQQLWDLWLARGAVVFVILLRLFIINDCRRLMVAQVDSGSSTARFAALGYLTAQQRHMASRSHFVGNAPL